MARPSRLLKWTELSEWQKEDNSFIETGYRIATPSFPRCVASWGHLHNESVNIYSHLLAAILFFLGPAILIRLLEKHYAIATAGDLAVFGIYLFGVAVLYTLSVLFHTLMSHSARGCAFGLQLDFLGIVVLMLSATVPLVYYTFLTEPAMQRVYWALTSFFALTAGIITFTPAFRKPATKPLRAGVLGSLALSTLICVIHGLVAHEWHEQTSRFPMWSIGLTLLFNIIGAAAYVLRFPERWWPRKFDVFGASHQIMHCAIVIASLCWLAGTTAAFDKAHAHELG